MSDGCLFRLTDVSVKLGSRYLLGHLNWQVACGQHWVVFGLNGSGKTTLLAILAGFSPYTSGQLDVLGQRYSEETTLALRRQIGFVSSSFFDKYYRREVVLNIVLSGLSGTLGPTCAVTNQDLQKALKLLAQMDLAAKSAQPFSELSKGERQKVLIARALIAEPKLLLLDEPGTGLDVYAREELLALIRQLAQKSLSMIYVTHYPEEILDCFDHALVLKEGQIYYNGPTQDFFTAPRLSAFLPCPVQLQKVNGKYYLSLERPVT